MSKKFILLAVLLTASLGYSQTFPPEIIVEKQVEAYNSLNLEDFLSFYAEDAKICYFPNIINIDGKEAMRKAYGSYFKGAQKLECKINKRIIRTNTVIDEQFVNYNGTESSGVAIYEVNTYTGKIVKVTFMD